MAPGVGRVVQHQRGGRLAVEHLAAGLLIPQRADGALGRAAGRVDFQAVAGIFQAVRARQKGGKLYFARLRRQRGEAVQPVAQWGQLGHEAQPVDPTAGRTRLHDLHGVLLAVFVQQRLAAFEHAHFHLDVGLHLPGVRVEHHHRGHSLFLRGTLIFQTSACTAWLSARPAIASASPDCSRVSA